MGTYYTYNLVVDVPKRDTDTLANIHTYLVFRKETFRKFDLNDPSTILRPRNTTREYESAGEGGSWDEETKAMAALSREFPTARFSVHWVDQGGCDPEARCITYWKHGKFQECPATIHYPLYNPRKLKIPKRRKEVAA